MSETLQSPERRTGRGTSLTVVRPSVLVDQASDNAIRWCAGERLHHLFERRCRALPDAGARGAALDVDGVIITFAELDRRANQMARHFLALGLGAGDRIGLIVDRSIEAYAALIGLLKIGAAYVPLDIKFPAERIAFIAGDARLRAFVVTGAGASLVAATGLPVHQLNAIGEAAAALSGLEPETVDPEPDRLCYIIYTSGSTGRPKGVAVNHSSICNFVQVAAEVYGYRPGDRVYQGMTLAFDFSVEELWVPLVSGATLVPVGADRQLVGDDLAQFLSAQQITALCCVPTLLATLDADLPKLRLLLVSGEACPPDIVARWSRPGRRIINAYGPTEATVTATWTDVAPDKAVTIGVPLPTYTVAILEPARNALVAEGAVGEIAIAGIGLAEGYVNRDDLTAKAFIADFLDLAQNPSRRLYRTGDLGRINVSGEIEYLGRIDNQVKIRGYRIELAEIENVLLEIDGIAQAVVTTHESEPGLVELAAYYTCFEEGAKPSREQLLQVLRGRLPGYMVPAYVDELESIPLLASHKADRKALPAPSGLRLVSGSAEFVAPETETEKAVADCLGGVLKLETVSIDDHFFDDLGAHSLLMGQFVAALNARMPQAKAAISDVYLAPSVRLLAADIDARHDADGLAAEAAPAVEPARAASDYEHWRCGLLQAAFYVCQYAFHVVLGVAGAAWVADAGGLSESVLRALAYGGGSLALMMALPVAAKWLLIGRFTERRIAIWSLEYFRFWAVQHLVALSPWVAFRGTALFNVYLRMLGAKVGDGAVIMTHSVPLVADLIEIGSFSVIRKQAHLSGYKAEGGYIQTGRIIIGDEVTIGERALIDISTSIGDGGQLGHASALLAGQCIPAAQRFHGSPARETDTEFRYLPHAPVSLVRRTAFAAARFGSIVLILALSLLAGSLSTGQAATGLFEIVTASLAVFAGLYALTFGLHLLVPKVLRLMVMSGKVYPLYGFHHYVAQLIGLVGYSRMFQTLLGDSSAIVPYLKWVGVRQPDSRQTGSNFGTSTEYDSPFEVEVGSGSMISDGLSIINFEQGSGSFRLAPARIGANCFVGNSVVYLPQSRVGDNCLLGTKVMVPVDGAVRENVGLLGSPCFEIPREVVNGQRFNPVPETAEEHARLRAKNAFNLRTALFHLASQWLLLLGMMLIGSAAGALYDQAGFVAVAAGAAGIPVWLLIHGVAAERLSIAGIRMRPHSCTIHEPYFWWVERHWKLGETFVKYALTGTPFRPMVLRLMGLKIGRKVFDDGGIVPEKSLVEIGDNCCLNAGSIIQGHSLEDGLFKSDRIVIGNGCTIGPGGFVHYGVTMGDNSVLDPDAFLMKGATVEAGSRWRGNPAKVV